MQGRDTFTQREANQIRALLARKVIAGRDEQKAIRGMMRRVHGFYISDFTTFPGFGPEDFDQLLASGRVKIIGVDRLPVRTVRKSDPEPAAHPVHRARQAIRGASDEGYVLDICDDLLGRKALRQHRFPFLLGDSGRPLPVDAYYPELRLVIEYREMQHTEKVGFFDRRQTVSGISRGEQRGLYDQRRRDELPKHGLSLVEVSYADLAHGSSKRLKRDRSYDEAVLREVLARWITQR